MKTTDKRRRVSETSGADAGDAASDVRPEDRQGSESSEGRQAAAAAEERDDQAQQQEKQEVVMGEVVSEGTPGAEGQDYLDDLVRLRAEFDNYRKRMLREQTAMAQRANARLVERLLPILDNLERAMAHGEGGPGTEMTVKELRKVLEEEGLEEIESEDRPFDPHVHEAFEVVEDGGVEEPTVRGVLRRGYRFKGQVLRPAMVQVMRPADTGPGDDQAEGERAKPDAAEG